MKRILVAVMWAVFPKPRWRWQARAYLAVARVVAGYSEWVHYRSEEWVMELEDIS
jgi:hypothetical protein